MKDRALYQLIEQARRVRDDAAQHAADASRDVGRAQHTLDTLSEYLREHFHRSRARDQVELPLLGIRERFTRKLDLAIDEQTRQRDDLQETAAQRHEQLIARQRRLLAFEALLARREAAQQAKRARAEQRNTDEIAAQIRQRRTRKSPDEP